MVLGVMKDGSVLWEVNGIMNRLKFWLLNQRGQSTTEYALVILAVVAIAALLSTIGVKGMTEFLSSVFNKLMASVK